VPGLAFLAPWFLAGAVFAGVPLLLHLLSREQARPTPFSAVDFVPAREVRQARRRRPSDLLLLLLRVAAIALLALAFARPLVRTAAGGRPDLPTVVAVDVSASLSAPGAFARAQQLAREAIDGAPAGPVGLVTYDETARVVVAPVADRGVAARALSGLRPTLAGTSHAAGLQAAARSLGEAPGRIVLVTDRQVSVDDATVVEAAAGSALEVRGVEAPAGNLAVTDVRPRPGAVTAVVQNFGGRARATRVSLDAGGRPGGSAVLEDLPPGAATAVDLALPPGATGAVRVSVEDGQGAGLDDERWAMLDGVEPLPVLVVGESDARGRPGFVQRALEAAVDSQDRPLLAVTARPGEAADLRDPARLAAYRVVVLVGGRGVDGAASRAVRRYAEGGGGVLVVAGPGSDARLVGSVAGPAVGAGTGDDAAWPAALAVADPRHPVIAALGPMAGQVAAVRADRGLRLATPGPLAGGVLLAFTNGLPALVEVPAGPGRMLVLASGLERDASDLARHAVFPALALEAVRYLAGPADRRQDVSAAELGEAAPELPGVVSVGSPPRRVAVNVAPAESSLEALRPEAIGSLSVVAPAGRGEPARAGAAAAEAGQRAWRVVLGLMFALLVVESSLAARRATRVGS
jgi:hypothetical protein